ncbi:MAG TPA: hypothetical protein VKD91_23845 [Pyrinomonadaceae bacterium]|nr:hypothetical protein [Pyrinomonadaceae bacterium]
MADASQYTIPYRELAEVMIKYLDIHEGFWSVFFKFGINGVNLSLNDSPFVPSAIVPILQVGINREAEMTPLTVDAAQVNPAKGASKQSKNKTKK